MRRLAPLVAVWLCTTAIAADPTMTQTVESLRSAAVAFADTLDPAQRNIALLPFDSPQRTTWDFHPHKEWKGIEFRQMTDTQQAAADNLLKAALSPSGYKKAHEVFRFEDLILELEKGSSKHVRHPGRYFYTVYGNPATDSRWGVSVEGHHFSLNLAVKDGKIVSSTPQSVGMNPARVQNENKSGVAVGTRNMAKQESLALELVNSLDSRQKSLAIVDSQSPKDVRDYLRPSPAPGPAVGISYSELNDAQRSLLIQLIQAYNADMPAPVAQQRMDRLIYDGVNTIHFAWTGGTDLESPHTYVVEAPSLRIELNIIQPDPAGNPANHIHSVVRELPEDLVLSGR